MYEEVGSKLDLPQLERQVAEYWRQAGIFEKSVARSKSEVIFYDGPPFPTGSPHPGTVFVSILKDAFARFFTMRGNSVPRRWGWDCHGLPIETAVEKALGVTNKKQIESEIGIARFNDACRELVAGYDESWERYVHRVGRWVDYPNAYRTMDRDYMESVIWVFAESYRKGLIYRDYRVVPYCYRCETSLSASDTRESDATRPRQDPALTVKFRARRSVDQRPAYLLAWTTTPWTLPSNLALALHPEHEYVAVGAEDEVWILGAGAFNAGLVGSRDVLRTFAGRELVGWEYDPIFPYFADDAAAGAFRVLGASFVATNEGSGIVHVAPAFGEDDYWLCRREGIALRNPVDEAGRFTAAVPEFLGMNVHDANPKIIGHLKAAALVVRHDTVEHNYPHCWRCRTPLVYRAMDACYYRVEKIKDRLLAANEEINWVPDTVKHGRFGKWIDAARDWNISRNRYWGTPIPVWECTGCEARWVADSAAALEQRAGRRLPDLHIQHLDGIEFPCTTPGCTGTMRRVPEVLDGWFESGAMPFGQCHYPFENREWFESHYPADFIVEYPGQIRGWFYCMHVLAVGVMDRPAFRSCLVHGTLLTEDGSKMSKSLRNYTDPMILLDRHGADALRLYLLGSPAAVMADLRFRDADVAEHVRRVLLPFWNAYSFFVTYANIDGYTADSSERPSPADELDRWILARLAAAVTVCTRGLAGYATNTATVAVVEFIGDLTNWYIRRSRKRFWAPGLDDTKRSGYDTLYYVLTVLSQLLAPLAPFIAEQVYRGLHPTGAASVHLTDWPDVVAKPEDDLLMQEVATTQQIARMGLSLRKQAGIRVRQPLAAAQIHGPRLGPEMQELIRAARNGHVRQEGDRVVVSSGSRTWQLAPDEIDVGYQGKDGTTVAAESGILVALDTVVSDDLRIEGWANEVNRHVQDLRKQTGYAVTDRIELEIVGDLPDHWRQTVAGWALADLAEVHAPDGTADLSVDGVSFQVKVRRSSSVSNNVECA
ncbi:MAG: isoleucine--tRNA ligase [Spirochaetaceae bacterium]|nr:MAG: isoleucine--tRNA ligase [Spirochaetaceae bacterium]